MNLKEYPL